MRVLKFSPIRGTTSVINNVKSAVDKKDTKEIEIEFRDAGEVYYVKLHIGDLFNLILKLMGK